MASSLPQGAQTRGSLKALGQAARAQAKVLKQEAKTLEREREDILLGSAAAVLDVDDDIEENDKRLARAQAIRAYHRQPKPGTAPTPKAKKAKVKKANTKKTAKNKKTKKPTAKPTWWERLGHWQLVIVAALGALIGLFIWGLATSNPDGSTDIASTVWAMIAFIAFVALIGTLAYWYVVKQLKNRS